MGFNSGFKGLNESALKNDDMSALTSDTRLTNSEG